MVRCIDTMIRRFFTHRKSQPYGPWLLALLVFLAATVPSLQMLRQASSSTLTIELCSTRGQSARRIATVPTVPTVQLVDAAPAIPAEHSARPHCPLCISTDSTASIPPSSGELLLARIDYVERVRLSPQGEQLSSQRHTTAQPRAPPALA